MKIVESYNSLEEVKDYFEKLIREQFERIEKISQNQEIIKFREIVPIKIGFIGGDGIGPYIV
ncbi:MAG: isocitrate/isopropylmalate dehydrogenase family protein, partial [bacterium]